ncbi:MAG: hypothetical protein H0X43_12170 [Nitrosospira sp.]|nr:hypothetical protein [Nitrosospira sp.]
MKNIRIVLTAIGSAAIFSMAPAAIAEESPGLVNVDISNVANLIAERINVEAAQIPKTVQIPVNVAAEVCSVAANVLGERARTGSGSCTAELATNDLNQIVRRQLEGISR